MYSLKNSFQFLRNNSPIRKIKNKLVSNQFLQTPITKSKIIKNNPDLDIYVVAFNNAKLIEAQNYFLKKNLKDKFRLIIVDNSNDSNKSKEIENFCLDNQISYIKLPKNKLYSSYSHWLSLNYIMKNIVNKQDTKYIWFLDHDCFLIKEISIVKILEKQKLFWLIMDNIPFKIWWHILNFSGNRRIIRPWCAFYDKNLFDKWYDFFPNKRWIPISFLDTWWWNWKYIYKYYSKNSLDLLGLKEDTNIKWAENLWNTFVHLWGAWYRSNNIINEMYKKLYNYYSWQ